MSNRGYLRAAVRGALTGCVLAISACAPTPTIKTDYDNTVNFANYRTFSWVFTGVPSGMNPLVFQRVKDSIDRQLQTRFTPAQPGDFAVAFTLGRRDSVQVTDFGPYGPFYRGWGWGPGWGNSNIDVRNVTNGTLVIDIYDTATKRPVWHGIATQEVNPSRVPDQATIDNVIAQVLAKFPPASATQ